jgi:hypothetical protein
VVYPQRRRLKPPTNDIAVCATFGAGMLRRGGWEADMGEWVGSVLFLSALGLSGSKIAEDFGNRGLRGYAMLLVVLAIYAGAVAVVWA